MARKKQLKKSGNKHEILGICLIATGIFLLTCLFADPSKVGMLGKTSDLLFGLFGILGYAIPFIIVAVGIALIALSDSIVKSGTYYLVLLAIWFILAIIQVEAKSTIGDTSVFLYIKDAFTDGLAFKTGGGAFGALLSYPAIILLGILGSYIFFIAAIVIIIMVVTKLSIRATGKKLGDKVKESFSAAAVNSSRQKLYTEDLDPPLAIKKSRAATRNASKPAFKPSANEALDDLSFIPSYGPIKRKNTETKHPSDDLFLDNIVVTPAASSITPPAASERVSRVSQFAPQPIGSHAAESPVNKPDGKVTAEHIPTNPSKNTEYKCPPLTLLNETKLGSLKTGADSPGEKARLLIDTLASFNISVKLLNVTVGPVITRYELQPAQGVRVNKITTLADDIALALAAPRVRIEAPIPGKAAIGIEIPNRDTATVLIREIIESPEFARMKSPISFALGKDIAGKIMTADLDRMPHMLIAGSTGSGKSVCINCIILSMIYKSAPSDLRLILIDPKVVELNMFSVLPHMLVPVVTEPKRAAGALKWAVLEMEQRYQKMAKFGARDLARYNSLQAADEDKLPKIVIVIDELADLMMVAAKDVEESICRIAQLGRACGIHLIVATQRPSADIITGLIKANIPTRIAFAVSSSVDSRVILDSTGAEKLLGRGDMLFHPNGANKPVRIQGAYVSDEEVERVTGFFANQNNEPTFVESAIKEISIASSPETQAKGGSAHEDDLLPDAVKIVLDSGQASISMIQRRLRVGYARAARLIDIMEQKNIVSGFDGSKPRKLLIDYSDYQQLFGTNEQSEDI